MSGTVGDIRTWGVGPPRRIQPLVLMYHSVAPYVEDPYLVTVSPARFERQMRWLRRRGLRGTSVGALMAARAAGSDRGLVGLSFDDGYADFAQYALPVLRRFGFTATVFVVADRMGGMNAWDVLGARKPLLSAQQVRAAARDGMEIGSHGLRHVSLTSVDSAELAAEVAGSRAILQDVSGQQVDGFCYPYGRVDTVTVDAVRTAGYRYGCAIWRCPLTSVHALPRVYIGDRDGPLRLLAKWYRHQVPARQDLRRGGRRPQPA